MQLVAVTVSVGCGDFLNYSLPHNVRSFDRWLIVTSPDDEETQRVCHYYNAECLVTDVMHEDGQKFNKGAAVNAGLERLDPRDWVVHLDADIVMPPQARQVLEATGLNSQFLYGCDRINVPSYEAWGTFMTSPLPLYERGWLWTPPFPVANRLISPDDNGYIPIGYFQMFNRQASCLGTPFYPTVHDTAALSDTEFARRWPRTHRQFLPELYVFHLMTEDQTHGANWDGRVTARFAPRQRRSF